MVRSQGSNAGRSSAGPAKASDDQTSRTKPDRRRVNLTPLALTEKIFVRARVERVYFAAIQPSSREVWDKTLGRFRFPRAKKGETALNKPVQDAEVEVFFPLRLGGPFRMRYALVRQPQGFALEAVRGSLGLLVGFAESWQFVSARGGTEVTLTRSVVPRFKRLKGYVERTHRTAMKRSLEGLKKFAEENVNK